MKIYVINDCDFIAAESEQDAIKCWENTTGESYKDYDGEIYEHSKSADELTMWTDETLKKKITFTEALKGKKLPYYIASSEW